MVNEKTISQKIFLKAIPKVIYETFMNSEKHSKFTGLRAEIDPKMGGKFSVGNNYAKGVTTKLVKDEKITQTWRPDEEQWPESHYSVINLDLEPKGEGTLLNFNQSGIPNACYELIRSGWDKYYWNPLKKYVENPN